MTCRRTAYNNYNSLEKNAPCWHKIMAYCGIAPKSNHHFSREKNARSSSRRSACQLLLRGIRLPMACSAVTSGQTPAGAVKRQGRGLWVESGRLRDGKLATWKYDVQLSTTDESNICQHPKWNIITYLSVVKYHPIFE